jgi:hypothetical protein
VQAALWLAVLVLAQFPLSWGASGAIGLATSSLDVPSHELSQDRVSGVRDGLRLTSEGSDGGDPFPPTIAPRPAQLALAGITPAVASCLPAPASAPALGYEACGPPGRSQL